MILMASLSSLTARMCQPPRQMIDTRSPVLPSGRVGNPLAEASSAPCAGREGQGGARGEGGLQKFTAIVGFVTHGLSPGEVCLREISGCFGDEDVC